MMATVVLHCLTLKKNRNAKDHERFGKVKADRASMNESCSETGPQAALLVWKFIYLTRH